MLRIMLKRHAFLSKCNNVRRFCSISTKYDVVVIGGGHAGCEAAAASARMGMSHSACDAEEGYDWRDGLQSFRGLSERARWSERWTRWTDSSVV